jgi:hypothetical protein
MNSLQQLSTIAVFFLVLSTVGPIQQKEVRVRTEDRARGLDHDVRAFGAKGDGRATDSEAINKAIDAASVFQLQNVTDFRVSHCKGMKDTKLDRVERMKL